MTIRSKWLRWAGAVALVYIALLGLAYAVGGKPAAGCLIAGNARMTTAAGDGASFTGLVAASPPGGSLQFADAGPRRPLSARSLTVTAATCAPARATISGRATVTGVSGPVPFQIELRLAGALSFRVRLGSGYDSGVSRASVSRLSVAGRRY